jgi:hypothetical protein
MVCVISHHVTDLSPRHNLCMCGHHDFASELKTDNKILTWRRLQTKCWKSVYMHWLKNHAPCTLLSCTTLVHLHVKFKLIIGILPYHTVLDQSIFDKVRHLIDTRNYNTKIPCRSAMKKISSTAESHAGNLLNIHCSHQVRVCISDWLATVKPLYPWCVFSHRQI